VKKAKKVDDDDEAWGPSAANSVLNWKAEKGSRKERGANSSAADNEGEIGGVKHAAIGEEGGGGGERAERAERGRKTRMRASERSELVTTSVQTREII